MNWRRWAATRYFFPLDEQGELRLDYYVLHVRTYLRRNLLVFCCMIALQQPLTGVSPLAPAAMPSTLWQVLYFLAMMPFGIMATVCALLYWDLRKRR